MFEVICTCSVPVSYGDSLIRFKLIAGLYDMEIKEDGLSMEDNELEETVKLVNKPRRLLGYLVQLKLITHRQGL